MPFIQSPRFPDEIAYGATGGPVWSTSNSINMAGFRAAVMNWSDAKHRYDVSHGLKTPAQMAMLKAFFMTTRGSFHSFRFKDWSDYQVFGDEDAAFRVIDSTYLQLQKRYSVGADYDYFRDITKPVPTTITISGSGEYTYDASTGIVQILSGSAPTNWTGEFDVPCYFTSDEMKITLEDYDGNSWGGIIIEEDRL